MQCGSVPKVILYFDVNGTVILKDTSKKVQDDYMLMSALAETTFAQWDAGTEKMSFKQYVCDVIHPGDKSDSKIKQERQKTVWAFLHWMNERGHSSLLQVQQDYYKIESKFTDKEEGTVNYTVFPSFYRMLEKLREMKIPFTIIFRSFGSDLPDVVKEIEEHPSGIKVHHWAEFKGKDFKLQGKGTIGKIEDIFDLFLESEEHFAVHDDWHRWNKDGEKGRSGKPFYMDITGNRMGIKNLSLFFDDNITGQEKDIVDPVDVNGYTLILDRPEQIHAYPVNTKEAMLDDDYFANIVLKAIKSAQEKEIVQFDE